MSKQMQTARLIPVTGISSDVEAEQRATSALLAVLSTVRPLSKALLDGLGAPKAGNVQPVVSPPSFSGSHTEAEDMTTSPMPEVYESDPRADYIVPQLG